MNGHTLAPPLFAREVTQLLQAFAGISFFVLAGHETLKARRALAGTESPTRHLLFFATGCLIFGGALVFGSLTKQWWVYYLAAVPCAFFIGLGVREDIIYVGRLAQRVTPFLRDELFLALGSERSQEEQVRDLKELLGKRVSPTLVLSIGWDRPEGTGAAWMAAQESAEGRLAEVLNQDVGEAGHLLLPVGAGSFAVCLDLGEEETRELAERLRACLEPGASGSVAVGIGTTHPPHELQRSYFEAQTALRAARQAGQPLVSYLDIGTQASQRQFPVAARDEFLLELKFAQSEAVRGRLKLLLDQMEIHAQGDAVVYRLNLLELLGLVAAQLRKQSGDSAALLTETTAAFARLSRLDDTRQLADAFTTTIDQLLAHVATPTVATTSGNPLERAKTYIDDHLTENLKVGDIAGRAFVSVSQLQRLFRDALGMSVSAYVKTARMQKAKELLAGTDRPVTEVAFEAGYNDSNYFSTAFRKHEGISPRQYRKQRQA